MLARWTGSVVIVLWMSACLDNKLEDDTSAPATFIAQQGDFADYKTWMTFDNDVQDDHGGIIGTTTEYLNKLPEPGASEFDIGTMLVKIQQATDSDAMAIHAMSKRDPAYNPNGARGWEFFELVLDKNGAPYILWRGSKPPSGEMYQMLFGSSTQPSTEGNCNDCHASGKDGMLSPDIADLLK
jgi:hypothetical protein